jgi:hypothetical protein
MFHLNNPYRMGTGPLFLRVKQLGCEADNSPPPNAKVKNGGAIPPLPYMSPWKSA